MNDANLLSDNPLIFRNNLNYKMTIIEKIKTINDKIEQNKTPYNLDRQTDKISELSSENTSKYDFFNDKDVLPQKNLLGKAATVKQFENRR